MVVKEQEEAKKQAEEAQNRLTLMIQSAIMIQSCWRRYRTRKLLNKDTNKKGKKGKKGSGKKGGKKKGAKK